MRRQECKWGRKGRRDGEEDFDDILNMLASDVAAAFEKIERVKDNSLIRNIIYSGIRLRYAESKKEKGKKAE